MQLLKVKENELNQIKLAINNNGLNSKTNFDPRNESQDK
jgi:hypothetical protein